MIVFRRPRLKTLLFLNARDIVWKISAGPRWWCDLSLLVDTLGLNVPRDEKRRGLLFFSSYSSFSATFYMKIYVFFHKYSVLLAPLIYRILIQLSVFFNSWSIDLLQTNQTWYHVRIEIKLPQKRIDLFDYRPNIVNYRQHHGKNACCYAISRIR